MTRIPSIFIKFTVAILNFGRGGESFEMPKAEANMIPDEENLAFPLQAAFTQHV